ncbi:MAG: rhodanese domain protein [Rickettsiales bacterium]|jgi:UPF0176 protein|nr:rhodanese domain protein [Rickettsiales bacterium]
MEPLAQTASSLEHTPAPQVVIAAFYRFAVLEDYEAMRPRLIAFCNRWKLKGTILLAREGINSTISGSREAIDALFAMLNEDPRLAGITWKESYADFQPFQRLKVRLKTEIVRMGKEDLNVNERGNYVKPAEWDALISHPDTITIDTRNDYEVKIGTFEGAVNPNTENFRDFPAWMQEWMKVQPEDVRSKPVAMFCTGGIRCEKSTALLREMGFEKVYHLEGGILQYFEDTGNKNGKWQGDCFVFDDRVAVNDRLEPSNAVICDSCNQPVSTDDLKAGPNRTVICMDCMQEQGITPRT